MHSNLTKLAEEAGIKLDELADIHLLPLETYSQLLVNDISSLISTYAMMNVPATTISEVIRKTYGVE
jgi:hypothetical protein